MQRDVHRCNLVGWLVGWSFGGASINPNAVFVSAAVCVLCSAEGGGGQDTEPNVHNVYFSVVHKSVQPLHAAEQTATATTAAAVCGDNLTVCVRCEQCSASAHVFAGCLAGWLMLGGGPVLLSVCRM